MADETTADAAATPEEAGKTIADEAGAADTSTATNGGVVKDEPKFTQADVDRIIKERLDKAKAAADKQAENARAEAERKAAEEQGEFKKLYETEKANREKAEAEKARIERERLIDRIAATHALPAELRDRLRGESEEELNADAEQLARLVKAETRRTPPASEAQRNGGSDAVIPTEEVAAVAQRMGLKMPVVTH